MQSDGVLPRYAATGHFTTPTSSPGNIFWLNWFLIILLTSSYPTPSPGYLFLGASTQCERWFHPHSSLRAFSTWEIRKVPTNGFHVGCESNKDYSTWEQPVCKTSKPSQEKHPAPLTHQRTELCQQHCSFCAKCGHLGFPPLLWPYCKLKKSLWESFNVSEVQLYWKQIPYILHIKWDLILLRDLQGNSKCKMVSAECRGREGLILLIWCFF